MSRILILGIVSLSLVVVGCAPQAEEATGDRRGRTAADGSLDGVVAQLADDLEEVAWTEERRHLEARFVDPTPSYNSSSVTEVDLLTSMDERSAAGWRATLVARIHVSVEAQSTMFGHDGATVSRCIEFDVERLPGGVRTDIATRSVPCPDTEPITVETRIALPQRPSISRQDERRMRRFLEDGGTSRDLADLPARLGPGLTASAEEIDGRTAIAVTARPDGSDCRVGLRTGDRVEILVPSTMAAMPGEYGCVPRLAVDRPPPPH